jgi:hypothetical protein
MNNTELLENKMIASGELSSVTKVIEMANNIGMEKVVRNHVKKTAEASVVSAGELEKAAVIMLKALDKVIEVSDKVVTTTKKDTSRCKDMANQLTDQLVRVNKIIGDDFEPKLKQLERLAAALHTLTDLNKAGQLTQLLNILNKQ